MKEALLEMIDNNINKSGICFNSLDIGQHFIDKDDGCEYVKTDLSNVH